jgi:hypothetical protein
VKYARRGEATPPLNTYLTARNKDILKNTELTVPLLNEKLSASL